MSFKKNMSSEQKWRVHIRNLETLIRIGIHAHEQTPQRVLVNAVIEGLFPLRPASIEDCFDYDHVHALVVGVWPKQAQVGLMETRVIELLEHIFTMDARVSYAKVGLCKPDIFKEAEAVGVEVEWTREDFKRLAK